MKNLTLIAIVLFTSTSSWSKTIKQEDFKKLSFNKMQSARWAYIKFMMKVEKVYVMDTSKEEYSSNNQIPEFFKSLEKSYSAYAATQDGDICFFGGWPSKLESNICKGPWNYQNDPEILKYGDTYNAQNTCGGNYFRCNPTLFGSPTSETKSSIEGIELNLSPKNGSGKGYCVESKGGYKELSQKCEKVSRESIPNIVNDLKADTPEGEAKRQQLAGLNQSIFGEDGASGFCGNFKSNSGEVYDACDDLKKRLDELMPTSAADDPKNKEVKSEEEVEAVPVGNNYSKAMGIMNACQQYMNDESIDDPFRRNFVGKLNGGLQACSIGKNAGGTEALDSDELDMVSDSFDKMGYLATLNKETFKNTIKAIMVNELSFIESNPALADDKMNVTDKGQFLLNIAEKFPDIKKDGYMEMFDEAYDEVIAYKDKIQAQDYEQVQPEFKAVSDIVNNSCAQINFEYQKKFGKEKWFTGNFLRTKSSEEQQWFAANKRDLNQKINATFTQTKLSPFLATEHFQDHVMDPETEFFENCLEEPQHSVINPYIQPEDFNKGVKQLRERLFESFDDLDEGKFFGISSNYGLNHDIDDYIKSDPNLILSTILNAKDDDQIELSKYLCSRFSSIQSRDDTMETWHTGLNLAAAGTGVLCLVPVINVGFCPIAAGLSLAAVGTGIEKTARSVSEEYANERALTRGGVDTGLFIKTEKLTEDRSETGVLQTGFAGLGAISTGAKSIQLLNQGRKGKELNIYNNGWEDYNGPWVSRTPPNTNTSTNVGILPMIGNSADDALPHAQKLLSGPASLPAPSAPVLPGPVSGVTNSNTAIQLGDKSSSTVIHLADKTGNTAIQLGDATAKQTSSVGKNLPSNFGQIINSTGQTSQASPGVQKGFEISTNVLPRAVANSQKAKSVKVEDLKLTTTQWKDLRNTHLNPTKGSNLPPVETLKFYNQNGIISQRGREIFMSLKNLPTSPSAQFSDDFLSDAKRIINTGNPKHIEKIKNLAMERLKVLLQVKGELNQGSAYTKITEYQVKLGVGKHPKGSDIERVAKDEYRRLGEAFKIIFKK